MSFYPDPEPLDPMDRELEACMAVCSELLPWTNGEIAELESVAADRGEPLLPLIREVGAIYSTPLDALDDADATGDVEVARRGFRLARMAALVIFYRGELAAAELGAIIDAEREAE